jgi:hypothetical protein
VVIFPLLSPYQTLPHLTRKLKPAKFILQLNKGGFILKLKNGGEMKIASKISKTLKFWLTFTIGIIFTFLFQLSSIYFLDKIIQIDPFKDLFVIGSISINSFSFIIAISIIFLTVYVECFLKKEIKVGDKIRYINLKSSKVMEGKIIDIFKDSFFVLLKNNKVVNFWRKTGQEVTGQKNYCLII